MAPGGEEPEEADVEPRRGEEVRSAQNLLVLRAAAEIVRRKKAEAIGKEEYEAAARYHQKLQEIEAQLQAHPDAAKEFGEVLGPESASGTSSSSRPARSRSLFSAPNPFRTVELLRQSGYSRMQAYCLLCLLYVAVFALEMLFLYLGWRILGTDSGGGGRDVSEESFEEL